MLNAHGHGTEEAVNRVWNLEALATSDGRSLRF